MTSFIPWGPNSHNGFENRTFAVFSGLTPKGLPRGLPLKNSSGRGAITVFPTSSSLTPPGLFLPLVVLSDPEGVSVGRGFSLITVDVPFCAASGHVASSEYWGMSTPTSRESGYPVSLGSSGHQFLIDIHPRGPQSYLLLRPCPRSHW